MSVGAAVVALLVPISAAAAPAVLDRISPGAAVGLVIPNLKLASDEIVQFAEGMGRDELLMGARPLDLLKSMLNLSVGIDDAGSAAIIGILDRDGHLRLVALAPVSDADAFIAANLRATDEPGRFKRFDGSTVYARPFQSHVALSLEAGALGDYEPGLGMADVLRRRLGERGWSLLGRGEMFIFADRTALTLMAAEGHQRLVPLLDPALVPRQVRQQIGREAAQTLIEQVEMAALVVDFDPLGLVVHSFVAFAPESQAGRLTRGGENRGRGLARLPVKSFYLAAAVDLAGMGGAEATAGLLKLLGVEAPAWLLAADALEMIVSPSPAGLQGGLLNDALLVFATSAPQETRDAIRRFIVSQQGRTVGDPDGGELDRRVVWEADRALRTGGADGVPTTADAYEIQLRGSGPVAAQAMMIHSTLFGNAGWRGFVRAGDDAVIMTFSQRPRLLEAAESAARDAKNSMANHAVIRTMRKWMPRGPDLEMYVGLGQVMSLMGQLAQAYPMLQLGGGIVPGAERVEPVGLALEVDGHAMQGTMVVPGSVLSMGITQWMNARQSPPEPEQREPEQREPEQPQPPLP